MDGPPEIRAGAQGGRDPLGRAHQLRVDVAVTLSLLPNWARRAFADRDAAKARSARAEMVERIASAIERRFRVTWLGSDDDDPNARPLEGHGPLFGGPASASQENLRALPAKSVQEE